MKSYTAADVAATTPEELARLREQGPAEDYAAWIRAAAELGLIEAQTIYGQMLLDGTGVERDPEQGLTWFKRAAHADHPMAINMVGRCYENGWGVPRDDTVAAYWFRLAADKGLRLFCEHTADAKARPGAHPNIDRLLQIAESGQPLAIRLIAC